MPLLERVGSSLLAADRAIGTLRRAYAGLAVTSGGWSETITVDGDGDLEQTLTFAAAVESDPIAWAVITKLARELSTLGIVVEQEAKRGRWERERGTSLEELLVKPAPGCGLIDLLQWIFLPALVEGNSTLGKYRPAGAGTTPRNLLPLGWPFMSAYAAPGGPVEFWVSSQLGFNDPRVLATSEVVHTAWLAPSGGALGRSPMRPLARDVRISDQARRFRIAHLRNAARPSGVLVWPADVDVSDDERTAAKTAVKAMHGGVDKAFGVGLLGGGVKWEPMSFSAADAQLGETESRSDTMTCVAYDVRWSQIADGNGTQEVGELARDLHRTLRPWASLAASALQRQLIDPEREWQGLRVRFDFAELLRGSPQEEMNLAVHGYTNGVLALDAARERVGEVPLDTPESQTPAVPHAQLDPAARDGRALPPSTDPGSERYTLDRGPSGT